MLTVIVIVGKVEVGGSQEKDQQERKEKMYFLILLMHSISLILGHAIFVDSDVANDIAWSVATLSRHSVENAGSWSKYPCCRPFVGGGV